MRTRRETAGLLLRLDAPALLRLARTAGEVGSSVPLTDAKGSVLDERFRPADHGFFHEAGLVSDTD
ncbi:hypothetical protein CCR83_12225 [Rhodobacter veldkampii DSM 11550]|uniref:Uncharacterized protein n=1 Tax=Phaeovulum veldkampii DSM 11550 TaxID=1185920 RepID=A0A2T4JIF4_9RHOB|nr:hypothetical protein [Phaeovulum veldkampii]MBK5947184.1 hypothetical protein [Phaeovulum veldkampii DSM 11550]PTE17643.1 hypothetical protein C5F46_08220 [Phaeovulum veldkampii DSM 11550]TDQ57531.1 hypothetical protein EV658_11277 [Phaeovulum veldkampii DSM 11550]